MKIKTVRIDDWVSVPNGTFGDNALKVSLKSLVEPLSIAINRIDGSYR